MKRAYPVVAILGVLALVMTLSVDTARPSAVVRVIDNTVASHPNALWHIVHDLCVIDMKVSHRPAPCAVVNRAGGYAILKDIHGGTQFLLIPTARLAGIESPELLEPSSHNYWRQAWNSRSWLEKQAGRPVPREDIGLAINSAYGRTQNQLHIHVDCVQPDLAAAIKTHGDRIGLRWSNWDVAFNGHHYRVRWVDGADLGARDPFKLLARGDPDARADMSRETLVMVGASRADGTPGFVLLSDRADLSGEDTAEGEELLDHKCTVLKPTPPAP
jgi:CDP-diacylglycerol pyrophosphatase